MSTLSGAGSSPWLHQAAVNGMNERCTTLKRQLVGFTAADVLECAPSNGLAVPS